MAKSRALSVITSKAKHLKKLHPHKFDHLKKKDRWPKGYIKAASAAYKSGSTTVGKKRKSAPRKKKARKRSVSAARTAKGRALVKYVEKTSTERVMAGKRKKRTKTRKKSTSRHVRMAGTRRRRSVSGTGGNMGLILGLGIGAIAVYLLTKKTTPTTAYPTTLPTVSQTGNYTRNTQSSDIVNYAMAAGLTITAITSLINTLNSSSDSQVSNIYDSINTTGDISAWV